MHVKQIAPLLLRLLRRSVRIVSPRIAPLWQSLLCITPDISCGDLDIADHMRHNYQYHGWPSRPQTRRAPRPGRVAPAPGGRARSAVRHPRLLRPAGPGAGQVRDAPTRARRGPRRRDDRGRVWRVAPDVLSGTGSLSGSRSAGIAAAETRTPTRPQAGRRRHDLRQRAPRCGGARRTGLGATGPGPLWGDGPSAQSRAGAAAPGKKRR